MSLNATTPLQLCTFRLGELYLGIDVLDVQEVLQGPNITIVPQADPSANGLINLRGQIATVVDLRHRLGIEERSADISPIHVVVRSHGEAFSLLVDRIGDVASVDVESYEPPPQTLVGLPRDLILGAYKLETELLLMLAIDKTVDFSTARSG